MISGSPTRASSDPRRRREERNFSQTWLQTGVKEERVHSTFHFGKKKLTFAVMMMSQFTMTVSREKKPNKNAAVADNDDVHGVCYLVGGPNFEKSSQLLGWGIVRIKSGRDEDEGDRGGP